MDQFYAAFLATSLRFPGAPMQADSAEELSEIENVVQRAFFLTRSDSTKRAA